MQYLPIAFVGILMAGCVNYQEVNTPPVDVQQLPGFNAAQVKSLDATTFRTLVQPNVQNAPKEVTGLECGLRGTGYVANFKSPAIVRMPNFGSATPGATVSCDKDGQVKTTDVKIKNLSAEERVDNARSASSQGGILGALIGEAVAAAMDVGGDRPGDKYGFDETIAVTFQ